jgi:hypothetical protein
MKFPRYVAAAAGLFLVAFGLWAFFDPRSFYEQIATFKPYNRHLMHDIGAFQFGLGATLLVALVWTDALAVALAGAGAGSVVHAAAHWWDKDLGGKSSDPYTLTFIAIIIVVAGGMRHRLGREATSTAER